FLPDRSKTARDSRPWRRLLPLLSRGSHRRSLCPGQAVRIRIRRSERSGPRVRLLHANSTPFSAAPAQGRTECLDPAAGATRRGFDIPHRPARPNHFAPQSPGPQQSRDRWTDRSRRENDPENSVDWAGGRLRKPRFLFCPGPIRPLHLPRFLKALQIPFRPQRHHRQFFRNRPRPNQQLRASIRTLWTVPWIVCWPPWDDSTTRNLCLLLHRTCRGLEFCWPFLRWWPVDCCPPPRRFTKACVPLSTACAPRWWPTSCWLFSVSDARRRSRNIPRGNWAVSWDWIACRK